MRKGFCAISALASAFVLLPTAIDLADAQAQTPSKSCISVDSRLSGPNEITAEVTNNCGAARTSGQTSS